MNNLISYFLSLIYKNICQICKQQTQNNIVCKNCEHGFIERKKSYIKRFNELPVYSWGFYNGSLRQGILNLKSGKIELANYFSKKIYSFWQSIPETIKAENLLIIPVPSHHLRIKERGYCQSLLLAKYFSCELKTEYTDKLVTRTKLTERMNLLNSLEERIRNIKGAFEIKNYHISKKNILIIDDILTSGSTICELARTIKKVYKNINLFGLTIASGDIY